ncbi:hypothetical protein [Psychroserpens damuponensis]|uniref:hypothetical protein n=1 Tax=Psychroserpens damuponensis TaxID=943936 RepID=UPI00058F5F1E|nr:hypothetical protein [Psychroserpens damuponensis]
MLFAEIQHKISHARQLDFGDLLNESIELFKKVWLQGFLMILIMFAIIIPFVIVIYVPVLFISIMSAESPGFIGGWQFILVIVLMLIYVCFMFVMLVMTFGLKAGLYRIMRQKDLSIIAKDDYLFFLRKPYRSKTIGLSLAYFGIGLLAMLLCVFPLIYVMVPLNLLVVIYAFNPEISSSNLIKASFELGNKKWLITFGVTLVSGWLAQMVGMLMCGVGIFATASFAAIPLYFIYKKVIGFDENVNEVKQIGINNPNDATF